MRRSDWIISVAIGFLFLLIGLMRPPQFRSETSVFVPLTLLEKQIEQNGIGFGSPSEIEAHIELMRSPRVEELLDERFEGSDFQIEVSKTRNGAVLVEAWANDPELTPVIANTTIQIVDSLKQIMLTQNVGQSRQFVSKALAETEEEMTRLQYVLDSLRFVHDSTDLSLESEIYKYNGLFSAEVGAMNNYKQKLNQLDNYLQAPAPETYVIYPATLPERPSGLPGWAMGILMTGLTALALYIFRTFKAKSDE